VKKISWKARSVTIAGKTCQLNQQSKQSALCEAKSASDRDKCPLKINEGDRNTIDLQIVPLTKEIMKKVLPTEEFLKEYEKLQYLS